VSCCTPRCEDNADITDGRICPRHAGKFDGQLGIRAVGYEWHAEWEGVVFWGVTIVDGRNFIVDLAQRLHNEFQWDVAGSKASSQYRKSFYVRCCVSWTRRW
jgi:hypothetical protein